MGAKVVLQFEPRRESGRPSPLRADADYIWQVVHEPAAISRWLLVGSETAQVGLLVYEHRLGGLSPWLLAAILFYNAVSLFILPRAALRRRAPLALLLGVDLLVVSVLALDTGAANSPFLGQFYLIIFAGALFYSLPGGLATGGAAALLTVGLGWISPRGLRQDVRDLIPYLPVTGALTGYLSGRLQEALRQRRSEAVRERERQMEAGARRYEMELARAIQEAALVSDGGGSGGEGLEIAVRRAYAQEVGGDFALVLPQNSNPAWEKEESWRLMGARGVVLGDVSGKGVPAALTANSIAYLLPWLRPLQDARSALQLLNRDLVRRLPDAAFVTLALVEILPPKGESARRLRIWSAGHPPAILWRAAMRTTCIAEESGGPILGVFPEWESPEPLEVDFEPGDLVVLYSDGLTETHRDGNGELFGTERVAAIVAQHAGDDLASLADTLAGYAAAWGPQVDDLTIVICRCTGSAEGRV